MTSLSSELQTHYSKKFIEHAIGVVESKWLDSKEFKTLMDHAESLSPGKSPYDRRTRAYKYRKWHEPRVRAKWLKEHGDEFGEHDND
jgi:hypothetical protein